MNLEQATLAALTAAEAGDLDALAAALAARADALAAGEAPSPGVHAAGDLVRQRLRELVRELHLEAAKLERFARTLPPVADPGDSIDCRG